MNRRQFLRTAPVVAGAIAVPAFAEPTPLTPDERIEAAIEEIKVAFREKWPDCPVRITDYDNETQGMVLVLTHVSDDAPGSVHYDRGGTARRAAS